ncbi:molybdopterin-containing oxidoreductase family protein [Zavarzinia sp. CC-PAN008]|uniref:molybdopterin-containing oxidoreductase family protein n=1 Tax=Zavarzinia sp. CC-PAN008 TaxID=3243332 RepID=UPI003F745B0E
MSQVAPPRQPDSPPQPGADGPHITYCRLCEALCGMIAEVKDGTITKVGPDRAHPISQGHLCVKGPGMVNVTYDPDRILQPMKRSGAAGQFKPVSWDEALDDIAARLESIIARHGGDGVAGYIGNPASFATLHYAYGGAFLHALGSTQNYNALHVDTGAKHVACELVYGHPTRLTFPDIERCDFLLMLGANPMMSHMSLICEPRALKRLEDIAARGGVVVVDPRRTETAKRFEHLPVTPDSDAWLLGGILKTLFAENLVDEAALDARLEGWRDLRDALSDLCLETASRTCGVTVEQIRTLARRLATAKAAAVYGRVGTNRGTFPSLINMFIESLNLVTGNFGRPGGWVIGRSPFQGEPAPFPVPYGSRRSRIGDLPLIAAIKPGGGLAKEILTPGPGQIRALFLDGGNPVMAYPRGDEIEAALEDLDLFVALDFYVTESTRHADYILPTTTFYERADMNDLWVPNAPRPWVQYTDPVIPPLGQARHEFAIYDAILERLGKASPFAGTAEGVERPDHMHAVDALLRKGPFGDQYGARPEGLSIERLRQEFPSGRQLASNVDAEGSWDRVTYPDRRPRLWHDLVANEIDRLKASATAPRDTRLKLFGRRKLRSMNSWMHNSEALVRSDRPTLQMHPDDARDRQIQDGHLVRIATDIASLDVHVEVTDDVVRGSVNYPHGWGHKGGWAFANAQGGANINLLASSDPRDWEQVSGMCLIDGLPVTVQAIPQAEAAE